jgi:hypothetical protein
VNPIATKYGASPLPQVNLVPKTINDKRVMGLVRTVAGLAILASVVLVILAFFGAYFAKGVAKDNLYTAFKAEDAAVADRDAKRTVYEDYLAQETSELTLTQIGWAEISYSDLLASILAQDNAESSFDSFHVYGPNANGLGGSEISPVFGGGVGRLDFVAYVRTYEEGVALVARLEEVPGIAKVYGVTQKFENSSPSVFWKIEGSAVITPLLLTGRLSPSDGIVSQSVLDAVIDQGSADPTASAVPSPEPTPAAESGN